MTSTNPTIIDLKTTFLRSQILLLSATLRPSSTFTTNNASLPADVALREKAVDEALYKLNTQLKRHNKLVYGPQATRHVAEQVDALYWGERGTNTRAGGVGDEEAWRERGSDLRDEAIIEQLPTDYPSQAAVNRLPAEAAKFTALSSRLKELSEKRVQTKKKLAEYRKMKELIGMFGEEGGVQDNLVTRNGEVEKELERMRMLMLRVERGVEGLEQSKRLVDEENGMDWEEEDHERLQSILE